MTHLKFLVDLEYNWGHSWENADSLVICMWPVCVTEGTLASDNIMDWYYVKGIGIPIMKDHHVEIQHLTFNIF